MNELKTLSTLDAKAKKDRYPNVPGYALPKRKHSDKNTNGLTKAILSWLTLNGHYCSRINSQGQYDPRLKIWRPGTVKRGIGDVLAVINGKTIMIEVKRGKDRMSKYQTRTKEEVEHSGGVYFIARDFDSFMVFYKALEAGASPNKTENRL